MKSSIFSSTLDFRLANISWGEHELSVEIMDINSIIIN